MNHVRTSAGLRTVLFLSLIFSSLTSYGEIRPVGERWVVPLSEKGATLSFGTHLKTRFTYTSVKETTGRDDLFEWRLPVARFALFSSLGKGRVRFTIEAGFDDGQPTLKLMFVDIRLARDRARLRAGYIKRPFSRQFLTPTHALATASRALTDAVFASGRDVGVVFKDAEKGPFEWRIGVCAGETRNVSAVGEEIRRERLSSAMKPFDPIAMRPAWVLRLGFRQGPIDGYSETDFSKKPFRWALATSLFIGWGSEDSPSTIQGEVDLILKSRGFTLTGAAYVAAHQSGDTFSDRSFSGFGYHLQASFLFGQLFEPVVRYAQLIFPGTDKDVKDVVASLVFHWPRWGLRWTTEAGLLLRDIPGGRYSDVRALTQLQFAL